MLYIYIYILIIRNGPSHVHKHNIFLSHMTSFFLHALTASVRDTLRKQIMTTLPSTYSQPTLGRPYFDLKCLLCSGTPRCSALLTIKWVTAV